MKKKLSFLVVLLPLTLSGCSNATNHIEEQLKKSFIEKSEIKNDEKYIKYMELSDSGEIDEDGLYYEASDLINAETKEIERPGQVYITFSQNDHLKISYYTDKEKQNQVFNSCYLNPNDTLYASVELSNNINSNMYSFSKFRIYEYSKENGMIELNWSNSESDLVLQIPMDYTGTDISVVPIGEYKNRSLSLNDYYINEQGNSCSLAGTWIIDDQKTTAETIEVSPVASYIVSYQYDSTDYFFVQANPTARYKNDQDGIVIFDKANSNSDISNYKVEIHPYISVALESDQEWTYKINDGDISTDKKKKQILSGLKYNDKIIITSSKKAEWNYDNQILTAPIEETLSDGYRYTFCIQENNASFYFDPSEYNYDNGSLIFKCRGQEITTGTYIGEGSQIEYYAKTLDEGYWLPDGDHTIVVGNETDTRNALNSIKFYPHENKIKIYLVQPQSGGTISYYDNGKELKGQTANVYEGTEISMKFNAWEGWICNEYDDTKYIATKDVPTCNINGKDVNTAFTENENHKPELTISIDESVGNSLWVGIQTSDYNKNVQYKDTVFKNTYTLDTGKIGTDDGIKLTFNKDSIINGHALKIITQKFIKNSKEYIEETRYVQKLPSTQAFDIYDKSEISTSNIYYESVHVMIRNVNVSIYNEKSIDNGIILVKYNDTGSIVKNGDVIDDDREVTILINPSVGYYVSGNKVSDDIYQETMTYKKYITDIDKIIKNHPIKKIYTITLNSNDDYGTIVYKLNGTIVNGIVDVREKQKLTMEYEITNPDYEIKRNGPFAFTQSKISKTLSLDISSDFDGKTISRDQYINITKKEGS